MWFISIFGVPAYIHSGPSFVSTDLKSFPHNRRIVTSLPHLITQKVMENVNFTMVPYGKLLPLLYKNHKLRTTHWEAMIPDVWFILLEHWYQFQRTVPNMNASFSTNIDLQQDAMFLLDFLRQVKCYWKSMFENQNIIHW